MRKKFHLVKHLHLILAVASLLVLLVGAPLLAEYQPSFEVWLASLRKEALANGISQATLDSAIKDLEPITRIMELDQDQPEFTLPLEEYLNRMVTETRVAQGRKRLAEHRTLLEKIFQRYGVQPRFLVALWGIETHFGRLKGNFSVIGATATLAYCGRRSTFFRKELLHALRILDQGQISADKMMGSWAGAMGHFQFMPSTFQNFAVDYEGDGLIDIWNDLRDAFASAANYLSQSGWVRDQKWGHEIRLPLGFDRTLVGLRIRKRLTEWRTLGVRHVSGRNLSEKPVLLASVVQPDGPESRAFLIYDNYRAILNWNPSHQFGIAVGTLADQVMGH